MTGAPNAVELKEMMGSEKLAPPRLRMKTKSGNNQETMNETTNVAWAKGLTSEHARAGETMRCCAAGPRW
jgi:hypothetical protein